MLIPCHPSGKRPDRDNLVPRGGGAFMNEVDGNLTAWRSDNVITMSTQGKLRGVPFEPLEFLTELRTFDAITDANGRQIPATVIREMLVTDRSRVQTDRERRETEILRAIANGEKIVQRALATKVGCSPSTINATIKEMEKAPDRWITKDAGKLKLTRAGREVLDDRGGS